MNTLDPGQNAAVSVSFDGTNVRFTFDIPRGSEGTAGQPGNDGAAGEVTLAQLTAYPRANTNAVSTLDDPFTNDPPTPADFDLFPNNLNEPIPALRPKCNHTKR